MEIDVKQLKALLRLFFSSLEHRKSGSVLIAEVLRASGSIELHSEPTKSQMNET